MKKIKLIYLAVLFGSITAQAFADQSLAFMEMRGEWAKLHAYKSDEGKHEQIFYVATNTSIAKVNANITSSNQNITANTNAITQNKELIKELDQKIDTVKTEVLLSINALETHMTSQSNLLLLKEQIKAELKKELGL